MKRFLTTTAVILTTATALPAQNADQLRDQVETYFMSNGISQPMSELSDAQLSELYLAITSSEDASATRHAVDAVLADEAIGSPASRTQLIAEVDGYMEQYGFEGPALDTLSNETLAELYVIATSSTMSQRRNAFEEALRMSSPTMENGMERGQIYDAVEIFFDANGEYDVDVAMLSEEQLNEVYLAITSSDSGNVDSAVRAAIN